MMTNKHTAIGYCRVSTDDQADNGLSLAYQEKSCFEAAKKDGYTDIEIIKDEGKTGTNLNRSGIMYVLEKAKKREVSAIYVTNSDRLARNTIDHGIIRQTLTKHDVKLNYLNGQNSSEDATSTMVDNMLAAINQYQSDTTKEKTLQAVKTKVMAGYYATGVPAGYLNCENPNKNCEKVAKRIIVPHPKTAHLVTESFKLYATGQYNVFQLNDMMFEKGLVSSSGKKLMPSMFYKMLKNRLYLGEIHWREIHVKKGKHEPLIDEATFNQVQRIALDKTNGRCRRRKYTWLLNGYIFCPIHKCRYTAEWHLKKTKAYYHCTNRNGCGRYIKKSDLENQVADKFKQLEFSKEFIDGIVKKVKEVFDERKNDYSSKHRGFLNQKNAFEAKLKTTEDRLIDGTITKDVYTRIKKDMEIVLSKTDSQIDQLRQVNDMNIDVLSEILAFTRDLHQTYVKAPEDLQKRLIGFFFDGFDVKDGIIIKERYTPLFQELLTLKSIVQKRSKHKKSPEIRGDSEVIIRDVLGD